MRKEHNQSLIASFVTVGAGTLIYMLIGAIGTPIITRLVSPDDYGHMAMLTLYSSLGVMLCSLGLDQALLRFFFKGNIHYQRKLLFTCCGIPFFCVFMLGIVFIICNYCGGTALSATEILLIEFNILALIMNRFAHLVVRLRGHTKLHSLINIIQKTSYILLSIIFIELIHGQHFIILTITAILSSLISALVAIWGESEIWNGSVVLSEVKINSIELLRYGIPLMLSGGITWIFGALDKLFIDYYCTDADVGIYASALNLMAVFSVVRTAFNTIWMPVAIEHFEKEPEDRVFYQKGNAFISLLMLGFGAAVVLFKDLFVLLLGSEYQDASKIVPFLMFEPIMYTISESTGTGMVIKKKSGYQIIVAVTACVVNLFGNLLLTPRLGFVGAAISTGFSYIVFFAIRTGLSNIVFYVEYHLGKFAMLTILLFLFASYGSFFAFSTYHVILFLIYILFLCSIYSQETRMAILYINKFLKKWF